MKETDDARQMHRPLTLQDVALEADRAEDALSGKFWSVAGRRICSSVLKILLIVRDIVWPYRVRLASRPWLLKKATGLFNTRHA